jgi:hypothetical protein
MPDHSRARGAVSRAAIHIEEASGWLVDAARLEPGEASEFHQATYDLNRVLERIQRAVDRLN